MAVTLLKVTNAGLRCGDVSIPVIKAVISTDGTGTNVVGSEIYQEIYSRATGMVAAASPRVNPVENPGLIPDALQVYTADWHTIGNDNGFKFSFLPEMDVWTGSYKIIGIINSTLYYKTLPVASTANASSNARFRCVYNVIFVDANNNIYRSDGYCGVDVLYDINPGVSVTNGITVAPILSGYSLNSISTTLTATAYDITNEITGEIDPTVTDPYDPGGTSETGGGTGTFDGTGDDIDIPSVPTLSAVDAGFITLFNPSLSELNSLASYMWSDPLFDVAAWKKIFADPMNAILGLSIVPVAVPNGGTKAVTVGNISTGVTMTYAASQYVEVDCGTLNVEEYWGAYLDYDPYTKAEIYLPYIGTHPLAVDDIMGKAVHVVYHVDILSGSCCAYVKCGGSVLYTFLGQCSSSIPITGDNWTNVINGALNIAGAIGSMVATGGASAPTSTKNIASTVINQMKPSIERSGSMSGTGGMLAVQTPYLILTRPRQAVPANQNAFMGYPSFINSSLSDLSGYTEVESIHLTGIPATNAELAEIESLLKSGVIF